MNSLFDGLELVPGFGKPIASTMCVRDPARPEADDDCDADGIDCTYGD